MATPRLLSNQGVDFVLVTALAEERDAVLDKLFGYRKLPPSEDDIRTYFQAKLPVTFPDGEPGAYRVIVMPLLGMGRVQAATATTDAITRWRPRYIVLVGIAGGMAVRGVSIGDILVADQIVDYELQKITSQGPQVRWEVHRSDPRLLNACRNFMGESWQELARVKRPGRSKPKRHIGPVASGDKVIAFGDVLERYREVWPKLIGVEMEAAGVATAAFQSPESPGFFMVRCVSDLADEHKGSADLERWRSYACDAAASFAIALLKGGPVPLLNEDTIDKPPSISRGLTPVARSYRYVFPQAPRWFKDRTSELEELRQLFSDSPIPVIIIGFPGMGKSSLAKKYGRDPLVKDRPKVWIECEEGMPVELFINCIADALDPQIAGEVRAIASTPVPLWQKASRIGAILDTYRCVLFLDAYEKAISTSVHDFVARLCEGLQEAKVIITSRIVPPADFPVEVLGGKSLAGLPEDDSIKLLQEWSLGNIDRGLLVRVYKKLAGNPELLRIFSFQAKHLGVTSLLDQLPEARLEIRNYLMTEALKSIPPSKQKSAKRLLCVLCTFRPSVPVLREAIEALYKEADLSETLHLLMSRSLVERVEGKYSVHDLVREFCASELDISPQFHLNAAKYYLARSGGISQASLDDLGEAYYHSLQANDCDLVYEVFLVLVRQLDKIGYYDWLIDACEDMLQLDGTSQDQRAAVLTNLGLAHRRRSEFEESIRFHEEALAAYREIGDALGEQENLEHLASVHRLSGRVKEAIELHLRSLTMARETGDPDRLLYALCNLGTACRQVGQFEEAVVYYEEGLALCARPTCDRRIKGRHLQNLGMNYYYLDRLHGAKQMLEQAVVESMAVGDNRETADGLQSLGLVLWYAGDLDSAEQKCKQAIEICKKIKYWRGDANARGNLGLVYLKRRQLDEARLYIEQAISTCEKVHNPHAENRHRSNLAQVFRELKLHEKALDCLQWSLEIACRIGDRWGEAHCLWHLGTLLREFEQQKQALASLSLYNCLRDIISSPILPLADSEIAQLSQELDAQIFNDVQERAMSIAHRETTEHLEFIRSF